MNFKQYSENNIWKKVSFCACSYIRTRWSRRTTIVENAMRTWHALLNLPFAEKIFLDDNSPNFNGLKILNKCKILENFDEIRYNSLKHAIHSNFGIVKSMSFCKHDYILHIDDDIKIIGSTQECFDYINKALQILDKDKSIIGINILSLTAITLPEWCGGRDYYEGGDYAYTNKYFGTAACLIRKQLLEDVGLDDVMNMGEHQRCSYEVLVSDAKKSTSFLVAKTQTPFVIENSAWKFSTTYQKINFFRSLSNKIKRIMKKVRG